MNYADYLEAEPTLPPLYSYIPAIGGAFLTYEGREIAAFGEGHTVEDVEREAWGRVNRLYQRPAYRLFEAALDTGRVPESERGVWREMFGLCQLMEALEHVEPDEGFAEDVA